MKNLWGDMMKDDCMRGLSSKEVLELRNKYGLNEVTNNEKASPIKKFIGVFKEPMFLLLLGTATIYLILGDIKEALIMLIFVGFVASITFIQEWKTEKTLNALKELTAPDVKVIRDGKKVIIKSFELVPGDIVILSEGDRIPADCSILEVSNFSVDESILTGEAEPVFKNISKDVQDNEEYWKKDKLYAGTLSVVGTCTAKVELTGYNTEYGKIAKIISETKEELTPLQNKIQTLVKNLAIVGLILCITLIIATYFYNHDIIKSILAGITLAMAIIPEEFPVVLTVFLSLGAFRLARKNALMRKISAVETLGSATILAVDKTGTITKNDMEVKSVFDGKYVDINDFKDEYLSRLMLFACEKDPYDPMEKAIIKIANERIKDTFIKNFDLELNIPFNSETKRMANIYSRDDRFYVAVKGSHEALLHLCKMNELEKQRILKEVDFMASKGLRVITICDCDSKELYQDIEKYELNFRGLIGLQDPPKEGVKEAIKLCKQAGIRVVMITGDYNKTAMAIGNEIGLQFKDRAITGNEIDNMSDEELCKEVTNCDIFSRVIPGHKMRIVKALKASGEIVAMTGDGVNDAPALKVADIGIAMGKRGTEVAKEAAHMVLMDDNFTTIVSSVKDGRRIFDNIRKAMVYIMVIHIPIICLSLFSPLFNLPQILLPVHIVLLELIIDPTCSIIFEGEEAEPNIMDKPPRDPKEPLLTKMLTFKVILQGISMFAAAFIPFHYMVDLGVDVDYARSFALVVLIVSNVILVLVNRSNTQCIFNIFKEKQSKARLLINSLALIMIFLIVYIPFLNEIFRTSGLEIEMLLLAIVIGVISSIWWEVIKIIGNNKKTDIRFNASEFKQ
ncbi:cation-translocating P-type ATPase [Clostridium paridis]|nr:cation-translocating P-type ATPase [Clostridium paridis]